MFVAFFILKLNKISWWSVAGVRGEKDKGVVVLLNDNLLCISSNKWWCHPEFLADYTGLKGLGVSAMKASISSTVRGTQVSSSIPSCVTAMSSSIRTCTRDRHRADNNVKWWRRNRELTWELKRSIMKNKLKKPQGNLLRQKVLVLHH